MAEELKGTGAAEETVIRLLEQQSKYGVDQETMLIYLSAVNLMNILSLIGRRYTGSAGLITPALPPLASGAAPAGLSLESLLGSLFKMFGNQSGGTAQGGQGLNPAALLSLLGALSQNVDLGGLFNMLGSMINSGNKPAPKLDQADPVQAAPAQEPRPEVQVQTGGTGDNPGGQSVVKREIPKVMKWDQLENRKK